ncbi:MAG: tetratricopeptide repeat protein [Planctomycetes bacterium]|nr:tetratricopeptide repeat protein [Planctomycetota bacterium]
MPEAVHELSEAVRQHRAGRLDDAERLYRAILRREPAHADALHLLGVTFHQRGLSAEAVGYIRRAIECNPRTADFFVNLAAACRAAGDAAAAIAAAREAVRLKPDHHAAHYNLGSALRDQGKLNEAIAAFRRSLSLCPTNADGWFHLAGVFRDVDSPADAADCYQKAIDLRPGFAAAHFNLGNVYTALHQLDLAEAAYRRAIELEPNRTETWYNLGACLRAQERSTEAIACYREAHRLDPEDAATLNNLGGVLQDLNELAGAAECYRAALQRDGNLLTACDNLGRTLDKLGCTEEAREHFCTARRLDPDRPLRDLQAAAVCPPVFDDAGQIDRFRNDLLASLEREIERRPPAVVSGGSLADLATYAPLPPYNLQFHGRDDRRLKEAFAALYMPSIPEQPLPPPAPRPRVGFVVTRGHEGPFLRFLGGVLERLDRSRFDLAVVCSPSGRDRNRRELAAELSYLVLPPRLDLAAEAVRAARFDVLYHWEVGSDAFNYFLPMFRLAPVQCVSVGLPVTTGIGRINYFLTSRAVEPPAAEAHYTENLIFGETLLTWQRRVVPPAIRPSRDTFGLAERDHVYLFPHKLTKLHPDFDTVLAEILARDSAARIVLAADKHGTIAERMRERWKRRIPDEAGRIVFVPRLGFANFLALMHLADVVLDPLHYGGGLTSYDAFSLGKAVVTVPGPFHRGRYTAAFYTAMGVEDCVATTLQDYVEIAVGIACDAQRRQALEATIREASHVLFENDAAVREHQQVFERLIEESRCTTR